MHSLNNDNELSRHVLRTLLYYDIFHYPLKSQEVFTFLGVNSVTEKDVTAVLHRLCSQRYVYRFNEFYSLQPGEANIQRRLKGNTAAAKWMQVARRKAWFIGKFPFVRSVMASGSLSKGYMDEKSDLDFFIVTKPNRLWVARMLLVLYKRLFLLNSHKQFCVNYFIDSDHLEIEEKNIFTATELATLVPLYAPVYYLQLMKGNEWILKYFPNYKHRHTGDALPARSGLLKKAAEKCIDLLGGDLLDGFFMKLTLNRWKRQYQSHFQSRDFAIAFKTKKYTSKNHPKHYQHSITRLYEEKLNEFSKRHDLPL